MLTDGPAEVLADPPVVAAEPWRLAAAPRLWSCPNVHATAGGLGAGTIRAGRENPLSSGTGLFFEAIRHATKSAGGGRKVCRWQR